MNIKNKVVTEGTLEPREAVFDRPDHGSSVRWSLVSSYQDIKKRFLIVILLDSVLTDCVCCY